VHYAATLAGVAFANAFLGACHSMAHKLGAAFHLPHGVANALLISNVIRYNANDNPTKQAAFSQYDRPKAKCRYAEIARYLGLGGATKDEQVESLIAWVESLKRDLDIPASIRDARVEEAEFLSRLDSIAVDAFDDQCTGANPRFPLISELKAVLLDSYYGRPFVETAERPETPTSATTAKPKLQATVEVRILEHAVQK
jgi:acetaldehyde dehydrogenase / alcohol dehydrogenase